MQKIALAGGIQFADFVENDCAHNFRASVPV